MPENMRGVLCTLADCMYFVKQASRIYCKHPEVHSNPPGITCPFYRMDWQRKAEELAKRFKKT
jgi:hypothetical protein